MPFKVTRSDRPIRELSLRDTINPNIQYDSSFAEWDAAIALGATLEDLQKWDNGQYDVKFKAKVIAWHNMKTLIESHIEDAKSRALKMNRRKGRS